LHKRRSEEKWRRSGGEVEEKWWRAAGWALGAPQNFFGR
jgi:hypothetical protein